MPNLDLGPCKTCGRAFYLNERDQKFYAEMNYAMPKHCKTCRDRRKAEKAEREALGLGRKPDSDV